ncbi:MAG: HD domain-containing protein, partial [Nitrospirae bacterium]|nr:HD domain-containing protein [Nitrospirota bacterium]
MIGRDQHLSQNEMMIAESVALFHDVGRFPQYAKYKTFKDSASVNHGELGAAILIEQGVIKRLPSDEQSIIYDAVKFHNALKLPDLKNSESIKYLKLIRDADKLDIWRIFAEQYETDEDNRASAAGLGLADTNEYSDEVIACLYDNKIALLSRLKTLNDFKLTQLSWVYDINFKISLMLFLERGYLERIGGSLPQTTKIKGGLSILKAYIHQRLN